MVYHAAVFSRPGTEMLPSDIWMTYLDIKSGQPGRHIWLKQVPIFYSG